MNGKEKGSLGKKIATKGFLEKNTTAKRMFSWIFDMTKHHEVGLAIQGGPKK